jgi:hypothetical protein
MGSSAAGLGWCISRPEIAGGHRVPESMRLPDGQAHIESRWVPRPSGNDHPDHPQPDGDEAEGELDEERGHVPDGRSEDGLPCPPCVAALAPFEQEDPASQAISASPAANNRITPPPRRRCPDRRTAMRARRCSSAPPIGIRRRTAG